MAQRPRDSSLAKVVGAVVCACAFIATSCSESPRSESVDKRLSAARLFYSDMTTIDVKEKRQGILSDINRHMQSALDAATANSLKTPKLAHSMLRRFPATNKADLAIKWIGAEPRIDGVLISDGVHQCTLQIAEYDREKNEKASRYTVTYTAMWLFDGRSIDHDRIKSIDLKNATVALILDSHIIGEPQPITFVLDALADPATTTTAPATDPHPDVETDNQ